MAESVGASKAAVSYVQLMSGDAEAVDAVSASLRARGYALLNLRGDVPLRTLIEEARAQASAFFTRPYAEKCAAATPSADQFRIDVKIGVLFALCAFDIASSLFSYTPFLSLELSLSLSLVCMCVCV
jgi:hypothetical protein